jgi:hypothetical protein
MNYKLVIPVILASIMSILPIFLILKYKQSGNFIFIFTTLFCYIVLLLSYLKIFTIKDITNYTLATQILYIHLLQILLVTLAELLIFKNKINNTRLIGFVLGVFSIYFLIK